MRRGLRRGVLAVANPVYRPLSAWHGPQIAPNLFPYDVTIVNHAERRLVCYHRFDDTVPFSHALAELG